MASRGANNQLTSIANSEQGLAQQQQAQNQQQLQALQGQGNQLSASYQNLLNNPGYTPSQQSAITNATMGSLGASYDALQNSAKMNAARTGNAAALPALEDQLAQQKGTQAAQLAAENQTNFANDAQKQQEEALQGLSGLYGVNADLLAKQLGLPASYFSGATNALGTTTPGFGDQLLGGLAGGLSRGIGFSSGPNGVGFSV